MSRIAGGILLPLLLVCAKLSAQPISLVKDINTGKAHHPYNVIGAMQEYKGFLYFAGEGIGGTELWRTDGTEAGTVLVKDIYAGAASSSPNSFYIYNDDLYFVANGAELGAELWKTNGTAAGTVLVKDIGPGDYPSNPRNFTEMNGILYFMAGIATWDIWRSDGTEAGTWKIFLTRLDPYYGFAGLKAVGNTLYFSTYDEKSGSELWVSDGTTAGTRLLADLHPGTRGSFPSRFFEWKGKVYFSAFTYDGEELWTSDGTESGTEEVCDINPGPDNSTPFGFTDRGDAFYFLADHGGKMGLWKSDGTKGGTELVKNIALPGYLPDVYNKMIEAQGKLFITTQPEWGTVELFTSDGTTDGTVLVKTIKTDDIYNRLVELTPINGLLCFNIGSQNQAHLWCSDGTEQGTFPLMQISPGRQDPNGYLTAYQDKLYFGAYDPDHDFGLWTTDGTPAGTMLVKDVNDKGYGSAPGQLIDFKGTLYFIAQTDNGRRSLFKSDGTNTGTVAVKEVHTASTPYESKLAVFNDQVYFSVYVSPSGMGLWRTDGSANGTVRVAPLYTGVPVKNLTVVGTRLFFSLDNPAGGGPELWTSDGTAAGTKMVRMIEPGVGASSVEQFTDVNGILFFVAATSGYGAELWKSDGTAAGTVQVKDIWPGADGSRPRHLTAMNGICYFSAMPTYRDMQLWRSDGTEAGTFLVKDLYVGNTSDSVSNLHQAGGLLYFGAHDQKLGRDLWKSDGTAAGTVMLKRIHPGFDGPNPGQFVTWKGVTYFCGSTPGEGTELWKTDGTAAGTTLVKDIFPGSRSAFGPDAKLYAIGDKLYFTANDGIHGEEIWTSDGTAAGTLLLQDAVPGGGSAPGSFTKAGNMIFASMTDEAHGAELWSMAAAATLPIQLLSFTGKREREDALLNWTALEDATTESFQVERSTDGRTFTALGTVAAQQKNGQYSYQFTDRGITALNVDVLYYRLNIRDIDGESSFSKIVMLPLSTRGAVTVFPNPVQQGVQVQISVSSPQVVRWKVVDNAGRVMKQQVSSLAAGSNRLTIDVRQWSSGVYHLQVEGRGLQEQVRFVK